MKKYIGTKIIQAEKCKSITQSKNHKIGDDGYKVVYEDGYESWSPKYVFENSYRECENMNFGLALEALKMGFKIARKGWNGKGMFIVYMGPLYLSPYNTSDTNRKVNDRTAKWIGEDKPLDSQPYIAMFTADKKWQPGWLASQADMLSDDWMIVE